MLHLKLSVYSFGSFAGTLAQRAAMSTETQRLHRGVDLVVHPSNSCGRTGGVVHVDKAKAPALLGHGISDSSCMQDVAEGCKNLPQGVVVYG